MHLPYIYADFNAIEYLNEERTQAQLSLTGYGTLGSLARQKLQLQEGMLLVLFESNDIECEATVYFDTQRKDPAGRVGEWIAKFDPGKMRASAKSPESSKSHPCIACGQDFLAQHPASARNYKESCSRCGESVMAPMAAPGHE